jgi:hypothetical protein
MTMGVSEVTDLDLILERMRKALDNYNIPEEFLPEEQLLYLICRLHKSIKKSDIVGGYLDKETIYRVKQFLDREFNDVCMLFPNLKSYEGFIKGFMYRDTVLNGVSLSVCLKALDDGKKLSEVGVL